MTGNQKIEILKQAFLTGEHLTKEQLCQKAYIANKTNKHFYFLVKIPRSAYAKWLNRNKGKLNEDEELTYLAHSNAKMFKVECGGYSLFGMSLADMKREQQGQYSALERIERLPWEYAIILDIDL